MDLTTSQREVLNALVNGYGRLDGPVTAGEIADESGRSPGTIYDLMGLLKSVGLVESVAGPNGGYVPTGTAFEALGREEAGDDGGEPLGLAHEHDRVDVEVESIGLSAVHHPDKCAATVTFRESVTRFGVGDAVIVGPTPRSGLVVVGEVVASDEGRNELRLDVGRIEAPLRE